MKTQYFILWSDEMNVIAVIGATTKEELNDKLRIASNEEFGMRCIVTKEVDLIDDFDEVQIFSCEDLDIDSAYDLEVQKTWVY